MSDKNVRGSVGALFVILIAVLFSACGGSSGGGDTSSLAPSTSALAPPAASTVVGIVDAGTAPLAGGLSVGVSPSAMMGGTQVSLDGGTASVQVGPDGRFAISGIPNGDHTLVFHLGAARDRGGPLSDARGTGLNLGRCGSGTGHMEGIGGFDGFHFGFVDSNGDGINDLFRRCRRRRDLRQRLPLRPATRT